MSNFNIAMEHGASSSQAHQMNPKEQIESEINSWFDETTWNQAEREISPDEVLKKEEEENFSYGKRMAYKTYLSTKSQHREIWEKMGVMKNFLKKWLCMLIHLALHYQLLVLTIEYPNAIAKNNFKGNALDPWILALEQGEQQTRESTYNDIYSLFYSDINLRRKDQDPAFLI
ncbi:hypothetical protein Tco_0862378 [Tanacetum coccineum]